MNSAARRQAIRQRREGLVARNDSYRYQIQRDFAQLQPRVDYVETVLRLANSLRSKLGVISGIVALFTIRSPNLAFSWLRRAWLVWQLVKRFKRA